MRWREALPRAAKVPMLRREVVYALDGDALERGEDRPVKLFSDRLAELPPSNCSNRRGINATCCVLHCIPGNRGDFHYERRLVEVDLRPEKTATGSSRCTTRHDAGGGQAPAMSSRSAAIGYPRFGRSEDNTLPLDARDLIHRKFSRSSYASRLHRNTRYTNRLSMKQTITSLRVPGRGRCTYELTR